MAYSLWLYGTSSRVTAIALTLDIGQSEDVVLTGKDVERISSGEGGSAQSCVARGDD